MKRKRKPNRSGGYRLYEILYEEKKKEERRNVSEEQEKRRRAIMGGSLVFEASLVMYLYFLLL